MEGLGMERHPLGGTQFVNKHCSRSTASPGTYDFNTAPIKSFLTATYIDVEIATMIKNIEIHQKYMLVGEQRPLDDPVRGNHWYQRFGPFPDMTDIGATCSLGYVKKLDENLRPYFNAEIYFSYYEYYDEQKGQNVPVPTGSDSFYLFIKNCQYIDVNMWVRSCEAQGLVTFYIYG